MAMRPGVMLLCGAVLAAACAGRTPMKAKLLPQPPVAKKNSHVTEIHGLRLVDDYFWLRDENLPRGAAANPEVTAYLKAEEDYANACMKHSARFQKTLYAEMLSRVKETDEEVPYRDGGYFYYTRTVKGRQYPIYCRKKGSLAAPEEVTLDLNKMARGHEFFAVDAFEVADDGNLLAFSTDTLGFRQYDLFVKNLSTGKISPKIAGRVTHAAWASDNRTLFYVQEDPVTKRSSKFFRHRLGTAEHELLYEEKDERFELECYRTRSRAFVMLNAYSSTTSEVRVIPAAAPGAPPRLILPRREGHEYYVDHAGDEFYIRTNDAGRNFRLVTAPVSNPAPENWKEIIPHRPDVMLADLESFAGHFVAVERREGLPLLTVHDRQSGASHSISFPEPAYSVSPSVNMEFDTDVFRLEYESMVTPNSVYDYGVRTREMTLLKRQPVPGYEPEQYQSERVFATAPDGARVPVSLVYKKALMTRDGKRPMLLEGYGSYGLTYDAGFWANCVSLLDRGVVYAYAHVRGGGEMGKEWHDQGKMMAKKNTFADFIACAEFLVAENYTSPERLAITGTSAGGLLMGAVVNMRPDLFRAVLTKVPFVDVINTMLDETLPLTTGEFLEWGNPKEKPAFDYMLSYSPYDNLERKPYPAILVRSAVSDSQVMYWEPAKYVAKLRAMKTDSNPLLFKIRLDPGGHGGASGRYDKLKDEAFDFAFLLEQLGIRE